MVSVGTAYLKPGEPGTCPSACNASTLLASPANAPAARPPAPPPPLARRKRAGAPGAGPVALLPSGQRWHQPTYQHGKCVYPGQRQRRVPERVGFPTRYLDSLHEFALPTLYLPPGNHSIPPRPTSFISLPLFRPHIRGRLEVRTNTPSPRLRSFMDRGRSIETCMFPHEH